jgi:hypothetical protein
LIGFRGFGIALGGEIPIDNMPESEEVSKGRKASQKYHARFDVVRAHVAVLKIVGVLLGNPLSAGNDSRCRCGIPGIARSF